MVACPVCSGEIEEDFGLVECGHCGSPVLLSGEGQAEAQLETQEPAPEQYIAEAIEELAEESPAEVFQPPAESEPLDSTPAEDFSLNVDALVGDQSAGTSQDMGLSYTVWIKGIDSSAIRREIKDTLGDLKFRLDIDGLLTGVRNGELQIPSLSPVKAALLVQRLRVLPVELRWEQERA